eukprot:CAMPEP_0197190142 /NCGR_PEP_ID=MMETSP1423-20130617/21052_1 /TAXON_ID=476441 /ORGANISM="Pseudo-nitzschia heimii, Strain UNC1101" /LENGTH=561 /DNA_ID=CAMNT_0042642451 /DNA_START=427 /DNA_END=2112 /DNA_ORIENTATION=-
MGGSRMILDDADGGEEDYHARFIEDRMLGEGEFGMVALVHDLNIRMQKKISASQNGNASNGTPNTINNKSLVFDNDHSECNYDDSSMACKTLRKGMVFKHNTVYAPLKPEVLRQEVEILRQLEGKSFCLCMKAVYETPRVIYLITELCAGGDMFQYVSRREVDLRTDEVSRISYQLLSAVDHCAKNNVINRDIKPENIMFSSPSPDSQLRLIDFGSGTNKVVDGLHTTFAGTAFYISPEMFQNTYTQKTDVWSVGVCLYVLVAGYPAATLQTAFNIMHNITPGERKLRNLPNMPDNLPDSYFKMLKELLEYKHKKRKTASQVLESSDFVRFHKFASSVEKSNIIGSVGRHSVFLDFQKFERSLTTLLATMLSKTELNMFVSIVQTEIDGQKLEKQEQKLGNIGSHPPAVNKEKESTKAEIPEDTNKNLDVITVKRVVEILEETRNDQVLSMIEKLPGSGLYDSFAYDIMVLKYFVRDGKGQKRESNKKTRRATRSSHMFGKIKQTIDSSLHSVSGRIKASIDFSGHSSISGKMRPASMDGSNHSFNTRTVSNFPIMTNVNL